MPVRPGTRQRKVALLLLHRVVTRQTELGTRGATSVDLVAAQLVLGRVATHEAGANLGGGWRRDAAAWHHWLAHTPVRRLLDLVDADNPMLRGERLLHVLQSNVLVPDLHVADAVVTRRLPISRGHLPETIVGELVHEAVEHGLRPARVHAVLPVREVVGLLDLVRVHAASDAHHPKELVDVVARIPGIAAKHDQHVVHV
mmetsp:Transcript_20045/g.63889  ORF Transcript_20045/g.63889 Transcript_20045/m.63889 type:complete len:200 (-) Transcript_20045:895-1494(-)